MQASELDNWFRRELSLPTGDALIVTKKNDTAFEVYIGGLDKHSVAPALVYQFIRDLPSSSTFSTRFGSTGGTFTVGTPQSTTTRDDGSDRLLIAVLVPVIIVVVLLILLLVVMCVMCNRNSKVDRVKDEPAVAPRDVADADKTQPAPLSPERGNPLSPLNQQGTPGPSHAQTGPPPAALVLPEDSIGGDDDEWPPPTVLEVVASTRGFESRQF